jgi:hypothetical protein
VLKATPGTLQDGGASFATTHWSVVAQSALTDVPEAANALAQLCELYWPPIYSFIRRRGYSPADAQAFFAFFYADNTGVKSRATFTYTVCAAGTLNCSNVVIVQFGG